MSSPARPGPEYHSFTKLLHWSMFVLFTIMFVLGFGLMGGDESSTAFGAEWDTIFDWHATLGLLVLVMATVRLGWRRRTALPPWAPGLSKREQQLAHRTEQVMYVGQALRHQFMKRDGLLERMLP